MSERTYIIRVDSSSEIGLGHLSRCLALANELVKSEAQVIFICRDHHGSGHKLVLEQNFELHLLKGKEKGPTSSEHSEWLGYTQLTDASESSEITSRYNRVLVIVDHYALGYVWESNVDCDAVIVIDDLANRPHKCSLLIDQSLKNTKSDYRELIEGNFEFIGGNIVILREEFSSGNMWQAPGNGKVLICMGGTDPFGYTQAILELIVKNHKKWSKDHTVSEINIVVGPAFDGIDDLQPVIESSELNIVISKAPPQISDLMLQSDLCILSCGTTILEACSLGVPSLGVVVADNQQSTADFLEQAGAIELYDLGTETGLDIYSLISAFVSNPHRLSVCSSKLKKMVSQTSREIIVRSLNEF